MISYDEIRGCSNHDATALQVQRIRDSVCLIYFGGNQCLFSGNLTLNRCNLLFSDIPVTINRTDILCR